jgi:phage gpG-like protein
LPDIEIYFDGKPEGSIKISAFLAANKENMIKILSVSGKLLERAMKEKLKQGGTAGFSKIRKVTYARSSLKSHRTTGGKVTAGAFTKSPYSDLRSRTGALRASITTEPSSGANLMPGGYQVRVGPRRIYARIHEYGGNITVTPKMRRFLPLIGIYLNRATQFIKIPKRSFIKPTLVENKAAIVARAAEILWRSIKS